MSDTSVALGDAGRLHALRRLRLLDTPTEESFERLVRLARATIDVPVALISLVDSDRQFFLAGLGLPEPWQSRRETPLSHSLCQYAVASGQELVVEDARTHPVLCSNLAVPDLHVTAYAGVPIWSVEGQALGTMCVADSVPRRWTDGELGVLRDLAGAVGDLVEARLALLRSPERHAMLGQLVEAQELERSRISAEIHDDTIQTLVAVSIRLQVLAEQLSDKDAGRTLLRLATAATNATDRLRRLVTGLRPPGLDRGALVAAVAEHAELVFGDGLEMQVDVTEETLPPSVAATLFRILQEALANVRAHADAAQVSVAIRVSGTAAELEVTDDGHGFVPSQPLSGAHFGLRIMRERAELVGGTLQIESHPGGGTRVRAWIPLVEAGAQAPA